MFRGKSIAAEHGWFVLIIILVLLSVLDRSLLYGVVDAVRYEFDVSDAQIGLLTGAYFLWPVLTGNVVGGFLADRFSKATVITGAVFLWGGATLGSGMAQSFAGLAGARVVMGFAQGMAAPTFLALIASRMTAIWLPFALGIYSVGGTIGYGIALAATSATATGLGHADWRHPFLFFGIVTIAIGAVALFTLRDTGTQCLGQEETRAPGLVVEWRWVLLFVTFVVGMGCLTSAYYAFHGWLPVAMKRHFSATGTYDQAALGLAISIGGAAGCIFWTLIASFWIKTGRAEAALWILVSAALFTIPFLVIAPTAPNMPIALIVAGIAALGTQVSSALSHATLQSLAPSSMRGRIAAANMLSVAALSSSVTWLVGLASTRSDARGADLPWELARTSGLAALAGIALLLCTILLYHALTAHRARSSTAPI